MAVRRFSGLGGSTLNGVVGVEYTNGVHSICVCQDEWERNETEANAVCALLLYILSIYNNRSIGLEVYTRFQSSRVSYYSIAANCN